MREITDSTAEDLLTALQGRIYYNPLVTGYEIKDRFIAGNVIEKDVYKRQYKTYRFPLKGCLLRRLTGLRSHLPQKSYVSHVVSC